VVAMRRFQQLSAPLCAKAVEDTAFYRYGRLISRNDVGFDARLFSCSIPEFHERMLARATGLPLDMLATATHDHKRGEDVRARLAVLSELASGRTLSNVGFDLPPHACGKLMEFGCRTKEILRFCFKQLLGLGRMNSRQMTSPV
jgi:hypothetical protein